MILAAADCTGHGVPGAIMSVIGNDLLNDLVLDLGIVSPEKILNELHERIRHLLRQAENDNKDGMDIAICVIDKSKQQVEFAGAKNPLVVVENNKMRIIKGDRMSIGGEQFLDNWSFSKHTLLIQSPIRMYMFSDGYEDQFGGKFDKKFMARRFRNLLFDIHKFPMDEQKQILDKTLKNWMGTGTEQVDDIMVLGIFLDL